MVAHLHLSRFDISAYKTQIAEEVATVREHHKIDRFFQLIDRKKFDLLVSKWGMDKGVRSFSTWEMTQALISCLVLRIGSYREVEETLGISDSTFGDALRNRSFGFFQDLCEEVLKDIKARCESRKVTKAINQLLALDSTECDVHGRLFSMPSWKKKKTIGRKASAKLHVIWNVEEGWIEDYAITGSRRHDVVPAKDFKILEGKTYVFDRAYMHLEFWMRIVKAKADFVTRARNTPRRLAVHKAALNACASDECGVLWEGDWTPSEAACYRNGIKPKQMKLRHIIYRDPVSKKVFDFITSNQTLDAQEIANIYRRRWSVELLFRWMKGHLNIRSLPTRTINAVKVQLAAAVLLQLLVQLQRIIERYQGTQWELLRSLRSEVTRKSLMNSAFPDGCRWKSPPNLDLNQIQQTG